MKIVISLFLVISMLLIGCSSSVSSSNPTQTPTTTVSVELQSKRLEFINKLIAQGIFQKVEKPAIYPRVWVTPLFMALNFDDKQLFIGVVYSYYVTQNSQCDMVLLYDSKIGKEIGIYAKEYGGLKMH